VIHGTTATNGQLKINYATKVFRGDAKPGFAIDLAHKDLSLILDSANRERVPLPIVAVARESLSQARASGWGGKDFSALCDFWCDRSGVEKPRLDE
jgi:4-hydroxybutyrate dehydrogenase/sulfolactaldehyde 3-reductase